MRFEPIRAEKRGGDGDFPPAESEEMRKIVAEKSGADAHGHIVPRHSAERKENAEPVPLPNMAAPARRLAAQQDPARRANGCAKLFQRLFLEVMKEEIRDDDFRFRKVPGQNIALVPMRCAWPVRRSWREIDRMKGFRRNVAGLHQALAEGAITGAEFEDAPARTQRRAQSSQ